MEKEIIEIMVFKNELPLTCFKRFMPQIIGEHYMILPGKSEDFCDILLISEVSEEFIDCLDSLVGRSILSIRPTDIFSIIYDSGDVYDLPIATTENYSEGHETPHWYPLMIVKGSNFPNKLDIDF